MTRLETFIDAAFAFASSMLVIAAQQIPADREKFMTRGELRGWSIPISVGTASLVLALTLPTRNIVWAGWIYFSMAILVPAYRWVVARKRPAP